MLNSKDKIIQLLKDHFNGLGIGIEFSNKTLVIRDNLLSVTIIIHIIIALLTIQLTSAIKGSVYLSPILFLYATIAYVIFWADYKSINTIAFDFQNKNIHIRNRSFVRRFVAKYFIPQPTTYYFEEIKGIRLNGGAANSLLPVRHLVNINLKNGESIGLISFSDEVNSILFSEFVTVLID